MKQSIKNQMEDIASYKLAMQRGFLFISILLWVLSALTGAGTIIFSVIFGAFAFFVMYFSKDLKNDEFETCKNIQMTQFRLTCFTLLFCGNAILASLLGMLNTSMGAQLFTSLLFLAISAICMFPALFKKTNVMAINEFLSQNVYESGKLEKKPGDAQIGVDKETGEPIILPLKDRYLHMLVLGPTGCGKTSQILTPMVYDDIQNKELGIIVLEPKGDFAEKVFALAKLNGRDAVYFNPVLKNCPYFNPLIGDEDLVIENIVSTFSAFDTDSKAFFKDNNDKLLRNALKVLKRLYGDDATFNQLDILVNNVGGEGQKIVERFSKIGTDDVRIKEENESIAHYFLDDYFTGINGGRNGTKTYENTSGIRNQISKLISNSNLNRVLNPPKRSTLSKENYVDFADILANGGVLCMCSAQGDLRDMGTLLGYFLILSLESAVFRRPGDENTRRGCIFYCDEFQKYANKGFSDMLTQGRSYRVASVLATQARSQIGMNEGAHAGNAFIQVVSTNARNIVLFPGLNADDAKYYSTQFGSDLVKELKVSQTKPKYSLFAWREARESESFQEREKERIRATDITYKQFGEASVSLIVHNTLQKPRVAKLHFISQAANKAAGQFIEQFKAKQNSIVTAPQIYEEPEPEAESSNDFGFTSTKPKEPEIQGMGTEQSPLDLSHLGDTTAIAPDIPDEDDLLG